MKINLCWGGKKKVTPSSYVSFYFKLIWFQFANVNAFELMPERSVDLWKYFSTFFLRTLVQYIYHPFVMVRGIMDFKTAFFMSLLLFYHKIP